MQFGLKHAFISTAKHWSANLSSDDPKAMKVISLLYSLDFHKNPVFQESVFQVPDAYIITLGIMKNCHTKQPDKGKPQLFKHFLLNKNNASVFFVYLMNFCHNVII